MSTRKLPKKVLMSNLMAIAAEQASHDDEHRARFHTIIDRIAARLFTMQDPSEMIGSGLDIDFSGAVDIAKRLLRMREEEFVAAVAVLNTSISRVVNTCPSGKDTRDLPDWMRANAEDLRLSYSLMTPEGELGFISARGALWGFTATQIAQATKALRPFELARRAKVADEDEARAVARRAEIDAQYKEQGRKRREYEATNPPVPEYVVHQREWLEKMRRPHDFIGVEVVFEDDEFSLITTEQMEIARKADDRYLKTNAANMIREIEKLTEHTFERRWKTKAELHSALRAHFKFCGYDEELDFRWLRFGAYTAAA